MEKIGAFEANTHLAALLGRVAKGEKIMITRHGIPPPLWFRSQTGKLSSRTKKIVVNEGRRF